MSTTVEKHEFQTEARQLLDLMIHSIYSNKDIFLRELISNSSDALDKRRFEAVSNPEFLPGDTELHIRIEQDKDERTLSVIDNGIGMNRHEVIELIGTIAKSGTREFVQALKASKDDKQKAELIGQFGVGFYSTFMVADKVTLLTRRVGEETATLWESSGDGTYTIQDAQRDEPGTTVTLHLKATDEEDGLSDYSEEFAVRQIVKHYSDFVAYPIRMQVERAERDYDDDGKVVEGSERQEVKDETLNSMKAIWLREKSEVTDEEYNEFYKHIAHDWTEPMGRIQAKIEGMLEYRVLLYIPGRAPMDLYHLSGQHHGVQLYVKRVFIMDDCKALLPEYLRFLRGVVDSEDLSLNISREILQQDRQIQRMRKGIVSKVLDYLGHLRDSDTEKYLGFWKEFGRVLKEGLFQDTENQDKLQDLALFRSTDGEDLTSLQAYLDRMKPEQDAIYFLTGESIEKASQSPHLEAFKEKGYEVLLLIDPVDEVWTQSTFMYKDKPLRSAAKGAVDLGSEEEKKQAEEERKEKEEQYHSLLEALKAKLEEHVKEVRLSNRLRESPACLVGDVYDMSPQLEQMMRAMGQEMPASKRILELNPDHPIMAKLQAMFDANQEDPALGEYAELLFGQAILSEGGDLPNPAQFSKLVAKLMVG